MLWSLASAHSYCIDWKHELVHGKVLLFSQRRIADLVAYCLVYEFEDVFASLTGAQRIDATDLPALELFRRIYKLARLTSGSANLARRLAPHPRSKVPLDRDYALFFPSFRPVYEFTRSSSQLAPALSQGGLLHHRSLVGYVAGIFTGDVVCF